MKSTSRTKLNSSYWNHPFCVPFSEDIVPSSLFLKNRHFLIVDIETQNTFQDVGGPDKLHLLKISVACAYDSKTDRFESFLENELDSLFERCYGRLVIGYNIKNFDLPVMAAYGLKVAKLDIFDIMTDVETLTRQRFIKLDYLTRGTLGAQKTAEGLQAVAWWKEGRIDLIKEYCLKDVELTRNLFSFGREKGFVRIQRSDENVLQVPVQWN
jgi:DEAD/DEAH box helicase domain-containing protein